ncbi:MAG: histidinol-phosphatase HisJ family protein [Eubacteriales bacterium]
MFQSDFHLHSNHSFDSRTAMAEVCRQALDKNYKEICFTEHFSLDPQVPTYGHLDWDLYNADIQQNRIMFDGVLIIRKGIEICEPHRDLSGYRQIFANEPMDYILGSIHNVSSLKLRFLLRDSGRDQAYAAFFEETLAMVQNADIDGAAHLDLIKRYSKEPFSDQDLAGNFKVIEKILQTIIDRKLVLEINTSTVRSLGQTMPAENILLLYRSMGGTRISLGSDSHTGESIGYGFEDACRSARKCGFTEFCTYEKRQAVPGLIGIDD